MSRIPLSVTMIASNEEDRIAKALASVVSWVDDVVVVIDTNSKDQTETIAKSMGARVIINPWPGYGAQKRFAEDNAQHDWILNIDADERITPELALEIQSFFAPLPTVHGYFIPTHDIMLLTGQVSPYVVYNRVRLYNKQWGRFSESNVHDNVIMKPEASTAQCTHKMTQDSIRSFHHWMEKMNGYTSSQAQDLIQKQRSFSKIRLMGEFWINFVKAYFLKGFWRTGLMGYIYAMTFAWGRFLRQIKWYEGVQRAKCDTTFRK